MEQLRFDGRDSCAIRQAKILVVVQWVHPACSLSPVPVFADAGTVMISLRVGVGAVDSCDIVGEPPCAGIVRIA